MLHYIIGPAVICILGSVIGGLIGSYAVPAFMFNAIDGQYDLPGMKITIYVMNIIPSVLIMLLCEIIAVYLACRKILKESPASTMRPAALAAEHKLLIERIDSLWNKLTTSTRVVLRNIFSNKKRTILNAIGIAGSTAIIIVGTGLGDSVDDLLKIQYKDILICDAEVSLNSVVTDENGIPRLVDINELEMPEGTDAIGYSSVLCCFDEKDDVTYVELIAFDKENSRKYYSVQDEKSNELPISDDGIVISQRLCKKYGYEKGDTVTFNTISPNFDRVTINAKITDVSYQYLTQQIYCSSSFLEKCGVTPNPLNLYINIDKEKTSFEKVESTLLDMPEVNSVKSVDKIENDMIEYCGSATRTVVILVIAAFIISLAVVTCISSINYTERKRNLASMKAMGYGNNKIFGLFVKENIFITVVGVVFGIPLGLLLFKVILEAHETTTLAYPYPEMKSNVLLAAVLVIVFTFISNYTIRKKINKIDMVENLKNVE